MTKKQYAMRLRDHLQMLKRRRSATEKAAKRHGYTTRRIEIMFELAQQIMFTEAWINEVKK